MAQAWLARKHANRTVTKAAIGYVVILPHVLYRGFERKGGGKKGYNIIVAPNQHFKGLKRRFGVLGSILDLNVGSGP
jgi:hypothetical protein